MQISRSHKNISISTLSREHFAARRIGAVASHRYICTYRYRYIRLAFGFASFRFASSFLWMKWTGPDYNEWNWRSARRSAGLVGKHKIAFAAASLTLQIKYIVHLFRFVSFFLGLHIYFHRILVSVHIFLVQCLSQVHIHWMSSTQTTRRHKSALQYGKNTPYMAIFSTILFRLTGISGVGVFRFFGATPPQKLTKTFSKI